MKELTFEEIEVGMTLYKFRWGRVESDVVVAKTAKQFKLQSYATGYGTVPADLAHRLFRSPLDAVLKEMANKKDTLQKAEKDYQNIQGMARNLGWNGEEE
jgi:hypothetical protein